MTNRNQVSTQSGDGLIFSEELVDMIRSAGTEIVARKNTILCRAEDMPEYCYYIESGSVVAYENVITGSEHIFSTSYAGTIILVPSMVVTHRLTLNFKTAEDSKLIRVSRDDLFTLIATDPAFSASLIYALSMRLMGTIEQYREKGNYTVEWRVCKMLLDAAARVGIDYDGKILIQQRLSQQAMADRLQVNRVTVARAIRSLKDHGLVEYINGYYCVRSADQMKRHMQYLESEG